MPLGLVAVVASAQIVPQRNAVSNFVVRTAVYFGCLEPLSTANLRHQQHQACHRHVMAKGGQVTYCPIHEVEGVLDYGTTLNSLDLKRQLERAKMRALSVNRCL